MLTPGVNLEIQKTSWTRSCRRAGCCLVAASVALCAMGSYEINLRELLQLHARKKFPKSPITRFANASEIPVGAVVICSDSKLANYTLGTVLHAGKAQPLPKGHPDGKSGELFVLEYHKKRAAPVTPGLLFVCFVLSAFVLRVRYFYCVCFLLVLLDNHTQSTST